MDWYIILGGWIAAGLTLFLYSFLYKDNPLYKIAEHLYLGISIGYGLAFYTFTYLEKKWYMPLFHEGQIHLIVPGLLGIFIVARLIPKLTWLSRYSFAFVMGYGSGLVIPRNIHSLLLMHAEKTVQPIWPTPAELEAVGRPITDPAYMSLGTVIWNNFSEFLIIAGVLTVLVYFFFSIEHRGIIRGLSRIGILFLMVFFGASYGATVMGRIALLSKRLADLKDFSSKDYHYATFVLLAFILLFLVVYEIIVQIISKKKGIP